MNSLFPGGEVTLEGALDGLDRMPKQKAFLQAIKDTRFLDYTGGWGAGKSVILCASLILLGREQPGSLILVGRNTMPDLRDSTRRTFLEMMPEAWCKGGIKGWSVSENRLTCENNTEYLFRHLDVTDQKNSAHLKALNLTAFGIDEGGEVAVDVFRNLSGRLRRKNTPIRRGLVTGNPAGHDWRWQMFHDPNRAAYFQSKYKGFVAPMTENPFLDPDYVQDQINTLPPDWVDRYVYGSFADMEDAVYKEWDEPMHVWDCTQEWAVFNGGYNPPLDWPIYVGIDIGGVDPWAFSFISVSPNGNFYKWAEIHQSGILIQQLAALYWELAEKRPVLGIAYDYENQQAAYEMQQHNITGTPANKEVKPGLFTMAHYLHVNPLLVHPFRGGMGSPRFFVSSACVETRQEYATYKWAKDRRGIPTGDPVDGHDHHVSADRYALHTFKPVGIAPRPQKSSENPDLDIASALYWRDVEKADEKRAKLRKSKWSPHGRKKKRLDIGVRV